MESYTVDNMSESINVWREWTEEDGPLKCVWRKWSGSWSWEEKTNETWQLENMNSGAQTVWPAEDPEDASCALLSLNVPVQSKGLF